jgi:hypothetical protein
VVPGKGLPGTDGDALGAGTAIILINAEDMVLQVYAEFMTDLNT